MSCPKYCAKDTPYLHSTGNCHRDWSSDVSMANWNYCPDIATDRRHLCHSITNELCPTFRNAVDDPFKFDQNFGECNYNKQTGQWLFCQGYNNIENFVNGCSKNCPKETPYLHSTGNCNSTWASDKNPNNWKYCYNQLKDDCESVRQGLCSTYNYYYPNFPVGQCNKDSNGEYLYRCDQ
jgi:hypothetical protein